MKLGLIMFSFFIVSLTSIKSKCKISESCFLIKNGNKTYDLKVTRIPNGTKYIYDIKKIGINKENDSESCWIYVWGTYTKDKGSPREFTKTGWVHVSDGGDIKVTIHGIYDEEAGSYHGRKKATIYEIEEGWNKLCK